MQLTYKTLGSDGKEYGPVDLAHLQAWAHDGRLVPESQVSRSDQGAWKPARDFDELIWGAPMSGAAAATVEPTANPLAEQRLALEKGVKSGGSWFYWIAGLSAVNTVMMLSGSNTVFIFGLGITQVFDAFARDLGGAAVAIILDIIVLGLFVVFGVFACKRHTWAFIIGMLLYILDALLSLLAQDWLSLAFHGFALFCIFSGFRAHRQLRALELGAR